MLSNQFFLVKRRQKVVLFFGCIEKLRTKTEIPSFLLSALKFQGSVSSLKCLLTENDGIWLAITPIAEWFVRTIRLVSRCYFTGLWHTRISAGSGVVPVVRLDSKFHSGVQLPPVVPIRIWDFRQSQRVRTTRC